MYADIQQQTLYKINQRRLLTIQQIDQLPIINYTTRQMHIGCFHRIQILSTRHLVLPTVRSRVTDLIRSIRGNFLNY